MNEKKISLYKIYDVYWEYNLTAIFISLIITLVLASICIILMVRYDRKQTKKDTIKKELQKKKDIEKLD